MNAQAIRASFAQADEAAGWPMPDMGILNAGRAPPVAMPGDVFGNLWPLIEDLAVGAGSPVDYVGIGVLAVAASLIGAKRRIQPFNSDWSEPCILWVAPVGDPSANKSPAIDAATSPLRSMELDHAEDHKRQMVDYETRLERAKAERDEWKGLIKTAAKEGGASPQRPEAAELPEPPQRTRLLVQDATPEAMGDILAGNPNGTLHLRDELAAWLMSFERYSPGGREFWLEAYGGRPHVIDRKNMGGKSLTIPFNGVSVLGGIQPEKMADCLLQTADDGLVARFLWAWPDPVPYRRPRAVADRSRLERVYRRLASIQTARDFGGRDIAVVLPLAPQAADIFENWIGENQQRTRDASGLYKGFLGKLRGTALRMALVVEYLAWADGNGPEPSDVTVKSLAAALTFLEDYASPTALRVFGDAALPLADRNAAVLARYIVKQGKQEVNGRDVYKSYGLPTLKTPEAANDAVKVLVEADWLQEAPSRQGGSAGRTKRDFKVNPLVHRG
ncbi:hypothetical protein GGQ80_001144 [Sphingomonas jinjuensis]|uniref:DUF3987 domain-containing protein n=1 Tax=Sphingomonas jinjuensis TaxID=535907 RepID=A0A840FAE4_9SPHN|nr:DUF3987 domain-containing protein [Sphingomonas jinjuensis]MBB4153256.1 hypothetical protein [Sphingomonas jinjuensis]